MLSDFLKNHITSGANYVEYGYGQVEPNHLSAQRTAQIYAQLPAASSISKLEQGQFVKYDYANGVVNFTGAGEWMLVYNEIKLYRDGQMDCEFAMLKDNYQARVYSPVAADTNFTAQSRYYNGVDADGNSSITMGAVPATYKAATGTFVSGTTYYTDATGASTVDTSAFNSSTDVSSYFVVDTAAVAGKTYAYDDVTATPDMYEIHYNADPFHIESKTHEAMMPAGTTMVPRVFKTNVGDIFTTNTVKVTGAGASGAVVGTELAVGDILAPGTDGILTKDNTQAMKWQVVKVYTLADHQRAVKVMRIA